MRLLIVNYMALPLPPAKGGAVEYLVDAFLRDNEKTHAHDITVYSIYDEKAEKQASGYKYTEFKYIKLQGFWDKLNRAIRHLINRIPGMQVGNAYISKIIKKEKSAEKYDAVIIENAPAFALSFPKKFNGKLILHLHNDYLNSTIKCAKKIFDKFSAIYTISNSLGDCVRTIENSEKIKTLYNGIDLERFSNDCQARLRMREKYGISEDDFVFMYCGRIVPDKGVLQLVKAFRALDNQNNKIKLVVVGGAGYGNFETTAYVNKVKESSDPNVIFTGFIDYNKVADIYCVADVGVIPSSCNDAFNLTTVEFMSNGIPIIISDQGAMKELVNNNCSVVVKYDDYEFERNIKDALEYVLDNKERLSLMGCEAYKTSKKFSIEAHCKRFNELLLSFYGERSCKREKSR